MRIRWTPQAADKLERIADFIRQENPAAERVVLNAIGDGIADLRTFPHRGRPGKHAGTRELVIAKFPAYIVVYRVGPESIDILNVWHAAQQRH
ncbi:MAG: type II toxin-antitoxin system RelE/ParE family toxin [Micropepsaceae bacterium]